MTSRTKSVLLLGATLVIGILLGALVAGAIGQRRFDRLVEMRRPKAFSHRLVEVIEPESEAQREAIETVLEGAAERFAEILGRSRSELRALQDSVRAELDPILTDEQRARLDRFELEAKHRFRDRHPDRGERRRGPGPGRAPPRDEAPARAPEAE